MKFFRVFPVLLWWPLAGATYERVYVFGDSYSDTGAGYLDGNGPTAVAYMAERLGTVLLPANDGGATAKSSLNFACSGGQSGRGDGRKVGEATLGLGMENQVDDFLTRLAGKRIEFDARRTLFFLAGGLNDGRLRSEVTVRNLETHIRRLYAAGARHIELALLPTEIDEFRVTGRRLNPEIAKIPGVMMRELKGLDIRLSRWGVYFDEVMVHPSRYGIENTKDACAGRAIFQQDATPCEKPGAYYYYHIGHPSTAVHKIVGAKLFEELSARK